MSPLLEQRLKGTARVSQQSWYDCKPCRWSLLGWGNAWWLLHYECWWSLIIWVGWEEGSRRGPVREGKYNPEPVAAILSKTQKVWNGSIGTLNPGVHKVPLPRASMDTECWSHDWHGASHEWHTGCMLLTCYMCSHMEQPCQIASRFGEDDSPLSPVCLMKLAHELFIGWGWEHSDKKVIISYMVFWWNNLLDRNVPSFFANFKCKKLTPKSHGNHGSTSHCLYCGLWALHALFHQWHSSMSHGHCCLHWAPSETGGGDRRTQHVTTVKWEIKLHHCGCPLPFILSPPLGPLPLFLLTAWVVLWVMGRLSSI